MIEFICKVIMKTHRSTADNRLSWRLWVSINYMVGGVLFLVGSFVLFPVFQNYFDAAFWSTTMYLVGSANFLAADGTVWIHYLKADYRYLGIVVNDLLNVAGDIMYVVGCVYFYPVLNGEDAGLDLFIAGSFAICVAETWKVARVFSQSAKPPWETFIRCKSQIIAISCANIGGLIFFVASYIYLKPTQPSELAVEIAIMFTIGGIFFFVPPFYLIKIYFYEKYKSKKKKK